MRPEMKSEPTRKEILFTAFHFELNEIKFRFWGGSRGMAHSVKTNRFCLHEINMK